MILCDIGNSFFHFYKDRRVWKSKVSEVPKIQDDDEIYYISVNDSAEREFVSRYKEAVNLNKYVRKTEYEELGIDRLVASLGAKDGIVVDAGSAITVDVVENSKHKGGFILTGIGKSLENLSQISEKLDVTLLSGVDFDKLPMSTSEAVSYGIVKPIVLSIKDVMKGNEKVFFTGGDGKYLSRYFENAIYDETLVFKGMLRILDFINEGKDTRDA